MLTLRKAKESFVSCNPLLAFIITLFSFTFQEIIRGVQPFGEVSTQINDQAVQFVPFASEYRRILLGTSELSSYAWTWAGGGGVPMHGNLVTYDGGLLFPLILMLVPENQVEFAFFLITALSYALAAAFMTMLLKRLFPLTQQWIIVVLAVGYSLSSWALQDGSYVQMWLSGLYMLPLLALAAIWTVEGRSFLSGVVIIALAWWSNYYTAYMASLGAGLFLVYYLVISRRSWRDSSRAIALFLLQGLLGVLCSAFAWLPTYRQVMNGIDQEGATALWPDLFPFLGHLLPWTQSLSASPSFAVTSVALILASASIFSSKIQRRIRIANGVTIAGLLFSFAFPTTVIVWNLFDTPNGNLWRAAFVVAFFITLVAGQGASYLDRYTWTDWVLPLGVLIALFYISAQPEANHAFKLVFAMSSFAVLLGLLLYVAVQQRRPEYSQAMGVLVTVFILFEISGSNAWMLKHRDSTLFEPYPQWTPVADAELQWRDATVTERNSPVNRVMLGNGDMSDPSSANKGFLLSVPALSYYSSLIPNSSLVLADKLGITAGRSPRNQSESVDLVAHGLMGTVTALNTTQSEALLKPMPFVHLLPEGQVTEDPVFTGLDWKTNPKRPVFEARNTVLGEPIYHAPLELSLAYSPIALRGSRNVDGTSVSGSCPVGTEVHFDGRDHEATIVTGVGEQKLYHDVIALPQAQNSSGRFSFSITGDTLSPSSGLTYTDKVSCFDLSAYNEVVKRMQPLTYTADRFGSVEISFTEPTTALAVLKMPVNEGYSCQSDMGAVKVRSLEGLLAVPVKQARVLTCTYTIPWQREATVISLSALIIALLVNRFLRRGSRGAVSMTQEGKYLED